MKRQHFCAFVIKTAIGYIELVPQLHVTHQLLKTNHFAVVVLTSPTLTIGNAISKCAGSTLATGVVISLDEGCKAPKQESDGRVDHRHNHLKHLELPPPA